jgi:hypothetical protein
MNQDDFSDSVELDEEALKDVTGGASAMDNAAAVGMTLINSHQVTSAEIERPYSLTTIRAYDAKHTTNTHSPF